MTSPSEPVNITSPRQPARIDLAGSSSPNVRVLRAQYAGIQTPPNIPARATTPIGTPNIGRSSPFLRPQSQPGEISPSTPRIPIGGITATRPAAGISPASLTNPNAQDDMSEEDKVRVVRRHLVSRQERQMTPQDDSHSPGDSSTPSDAGTLSKRSSASHMRTQREDTNPFPVPYHAHGADVTYVYISRPALYGTHGTDVTNFCFAT